jgi:hypothetical protein
MKYEEENEEKRIYFFQELLMEAFMALFLSQCSHKTLRKFSAWFSKVLIQDQFNSRIIY